MIIELKISFKEFIDSLIIIDNYRELNSIMLPER